MYPCFQGYIRFLSLLFPLICPRKLLHNMVIYWIAILFVSITFFYWQVFLRQVKTTTLLTRFAYNTTILINKVGDERNFSLMASAFLVKDFMQTNVFIWICTNQERVYLDMHCLYSFDIWLCNPISANW